MTNGAQDGKTVLITGGSGGIGGATARCAAAQGWRVLVGYSAGRDRAQAVADEIAASDGQGMAIHMPLHEPTRLDGIIERLVSDGLCPDAVVLGASPPLSVCAFTKATAEDFHRQLEVAVTGNHHLLASIWKRCFRPRRQGHAIAVLTAALGPPPTPQLVSYLAAKSALRTVLQCACAEFGRGGFRASAVSPGFTETPMLDAFDPRLLDLARAKAANGALLKPEDVARVIVDALDAPPEPGRLAEIEI